MDKDKNNQMETYKTTNPVLLIIFNQYEHTKKTLGAIGKVRPDRLYVFCDAPRADHPEDEAAVFRVRSLFDELDWECEVYKRFLSENLGPAKGPTEALNWVFKNENAAIILEHDCVPNLSFFAFCDELLMRYQNDSRISIISGTNLAQKTMGGWKRGEYSYLFSRFGGIHGWACWRRTWRLCDLGMTQWENPVVRKLLHLLLGDIAYSNRKMFYSQTKNQKIISWDFPFDLSRKINSGLSIVPSVNLISNIGFGAGALNTTFAQSPAAAIPYGKMTFPLSPPLL